MEVRNLPYSPEDISRRGEALYDQRIRPLVNEGDKGRGLVLDIETGDFEWEDDDPLAASHCLLARNPEAVLYARRVGYRAHTKLGGSWRVAEE